MSFAGRWFVGFGIFLILCGVTGYLSNPAGAKTALISGGTFGILSAAWGVGMIRGIRWSRAAALVSTGFLAIVFVWRSSVSWMAWASGEPKLLAASLITLMLLAAVASLAVLAWRSR